MRSGLINEYGACVLAESGLRAPHEQTPLCSMIGKSNSDDLVSNREQIHQGLEVIIDSPTSGLVNPFRLCGNQGCRATGGIKRSMSRHAEAEEERRARVIMPDGELQASYKLARAGPPWQTP
jgi:hypothetical protein